MTFKFTKHRNDRSHQHWGIRVLNIQMQPKLYPVALARTKSSENIYSKKVQLAFGRFDMY